MPKQCTFESDLVNTEYAYSNYCVAVLHSHTRFIIIIIIYRTAQLPMSTHLISFFNGDIVPVEKFTIFNIFRHVSTVWMKCLKRTHIHTQHIIFIFVARIQFKSNAQFNSRHISCLHAAKIWTDPVALHSAHCVR